MYTVYSLMIPLGERGGEKVRYSELELVADKVILTGEEPGAI